MEVDGLMEVDELLCSSPLDPSPSSFPSLNSSSEFIAGEVLGCGLLGRGETEPKSDIEGAVEVVGRRIRGDTGEEVMVETGEKDEESWIVFKGSIGPSLLCNDPRLLVALLTLKRTQCRYNFVFSVVIWQFQ